MEEQDAPISLKGKVAIVTGGSRGIGKACSIALSQTGAHVIVVARDIQAAEQAATEISLQTTGSAIAFEADIGQAEQCISLVDRAYLEFGRLDLLVNCAAYFEVGPALEVSGENWERMFRTNVEGPFFLSQAFARRAIQCQCSGTIINISSTSSILSAPDRASYSASKAAMDSLTKSLSLELAPHHIRVNAVAPGHTNTLGIQEAIAQGYLDYNAITRFIPMARIAEPSEVADVVLFLCSDRAQFITGQIISVDGGRSANGNWQ